VKEESVLICGDGDWSCDVNCVYEVDEDRRESEAIDSNFQAMIPAKSIAMPKQYASTSNSSPNAMQCL
jgi:hypothetical protein